MSNIKERIEEAKRLNQVDQTLIKLLNDIQMELDEYKILKVKHRAFVEDSECQKDDLIIANRTIKDLKSIIKRSKHKYAQVNILIEQLNDLLDK